MECRLAPNKKVLELVETGSDYIRAKFEKDPFTIVQIPIDKWNRFPLVVDAEWNNNELVEKKPKTKKKKK